MLLFLIGAGHPAVSWCRGIIILGGSWSRISVVAALAVITCSGADGGSGHA